VVVKKELREIPEEMYLIQSCINSEFFNFSKDSERYGSKKDEETVYQILRDNYSKFNVCNEKWNGKTDKPSIIIPKERCWYDFRLKTEKCYDFKNGEFDYYTNIKSSSCVNKDNIVCMTGYIWALFGKEIKSKNIWYQYNEFIRLYDSHKKTNFENIKQPNYYFLVLDKSSDGGKNNESCFVTSFAHFNEKSFKENSANIAQCRWNENSKDIVLTKKEHCELVRRKLDESFLPTLYNIESLEYVRKAYKEKYGNDLSLFRL
jgi:hypothetical protein